MKFNKRTLLLITGLIILIALFVAGFLYFKPQRDIQNTTSDYSFQASQIVSEYLENPKKANEKYLDEEGNSKILEVTGMVAEINEDFNHQKVVLLKSPMDKAGVSATFTKETNSHIQNTKIGETITIKGVIRSGASFDADLDMYENVIIEKSNIVSKK